MEAVKWYELRPGRVDALIPLGSPPPCRSFPVAFARVYYVAGTETPTIMTYGGVHAVLGPGDRAMLPLNVTK